jgi:PAS domain S-box-containing protein
MKQSVVLAAQAIRGWIQGGRVEHNERGPVVGPQVIWSMDSHGVCTMSTGPGLTDLGVLPGELEGQNLFDVYARDPEALEHLRRVLAGERFTAERPFGNRVLSLFYEPVWADAGTVVGAIGVSTDVTEQRRLEQQARAARERSAALAELSAAFSREILDPAALFRVAVRALTDAVAEVGIFWVPDAEGSTLEPRSVWWESVDLTAAWDMRSVTRPVTEHLGQATAGPRLDLAVELEAGPSRLGLLLSELTERFDLQACLRLPLRARGVLVGVIDVARTTRRGDFSDDDVAFANEVADRCALALDNALLLEAHRDAREQLVKFQALADASDNLIGIAGNDGRLLYVNPRVLEAGIEPIGEDVWRTVTEGVGEHASLSITEALAARGRWRGDLSGIAQGEETIVDADVFVLHHPDSGAELGTAWIAQDVTTHRATAAALLAANTDLRQFKSLVEASTDFIAIADLDGTVRYVNPPGRQLIGMAPDVDVTRTTIADYLTPEGLKASLEVEQPAVLAHGHWEGESTLRNLRGDPIPVAIASFLVRDSQTGEPFALATVQRDLTERLAAESALRELAEQRQALLTRLVDAQDAERSRIAADVHDDSVQALAAVDLRLGLLRTQLSDRAPDLLPNLDQLKTTVHAATDRLRALLFDLEPPDLEHGLSGALERAAAELFDSTTIRWSVDGAHEPDVPDATRAVAYRIAREALINARKHSGARTVTVSVAGSGDGLAVTVQDDGVGLGPDPAQSPRGHRGLTNMEDRAAVAGGRLDVRNRRPCGVTVTLWLPRS